MSRRTTLQAIAEEIGVSVQTVSNVYRETGRVADKTRARVQLALERHGYMPSAAASALRGRKSNTLCFLVQDPAYTTTVSPYLSHLLVHLSQAIGASGYRPMVTLLQDSSAEALIKTVGHHLVDGVILLTSLRDPAELERLGRASLPIVLFDQESALCSSVSVPHREAMISVVDYLHRHGARQLAYLRGPQRDERLQGFLEGVRRLGLPKPSVRAGEWSPAFAYQAFPALWNADSRPDAIVCANDQLAFGVMRAALNAGVRIPQDLEITGFDDFQSAGTQHAGSEALSLPGNGPELTSVRMPLAEMARCAVELLLQHIADPHQPPVHTSIPTTLQTRSSTRA